MFGFGREARIRKNAATLIRAYLEAELKHGVLTDAKAVRMPAMLTDEFMRKVSTSSMGLFAGQQLPSLSAVGLAMEGLCYGILDLDDRPADQVFAFNAYMIMLKATQSGNLILNDADYNMVPILTEQIVRHPAIQEFLDRK